MSSAPGAGAYAASAAVQVAPNSSQSPSSKPTGGADAFVAAAQGTLKVFNTAKNFGFICPILPPETSDGPPLNLPLDEGLWFFGNHELPPQTQTGILLSFEVWQNSQGKPQARAVRPAASASDDSARAEAPSSPAPAVRERAASSPSGVEVAVGGRGAASEAASSPSGAEVAPPRQAGEPQVVIYPSVHISGIPVEYTEESIKELHRSLGLSPDALVGFKFLPCTEEVSLAASGEEDKAPIVPVTGSVIVRYLNEDAANAALDRLKGHPVEANNGQTKCLGARHASPAEWMLERKLAEDMEGREVEATTESCVVCVHPLPSRCTLDELRERFERNGPLAAVAIQRRIYDELQRSGPGDAAGIGPRKAPADGSQAWCLGVLRFEERGAAAEVIKSEHGTSLTGGGMTELVSVEAGFPSRDVGWCEGVVTRYLKEEGIGLLRSGQVEGGDVHFEAPDAVRLAGLDMSGMRVDARVEIGGDGCPQALEVNVRAGDLVGVGGSTASTSRPAEAARAGQHRSEGGGKEKKKSKKEKPFGEAATWAMHGAPGLHGMPEMPGMPGMPSMPGWGGGHDMYFKTQPCPYIRNRMCSAGKSCYFAHSKKELRPLPNSNAMMGHVANMMMGKVTKKDKKKKTFKDRSRKDHRTRRRRSGEREAHSAGEESSYSGSSEGGRSPSEGRRHSRRSSGHQKPGGSRDRGEVHSARSRADAAGSPPRTKSRVTLDDNDF